MNSVGQIKAGNLVDAFRELQHEVNALINVEVVDDGSAIEKASVLAGVAAAYRRKICKKKDDEKFKNTLKKTEIPLPIAYKTIEILTHPALQFNDVLKRELSKTTRIFFELIMCQCILQKRALYSTTHEKLYETFKRMIKTLPEEEVECRFELKCCRAALKNLDPMSTRVKDVASKNIVPVGIGVILAVLSVNAAPPYVNPSIALASIAMLARDVYKTMPEWWYGNVLSLKLHGLEVGLKTVAQYKILESHPDSYSGKFKNYITLYPNGKTIKQTLKDCSSNPNLAFYICQVFREVIASDSAEPELKQELLKDKDLSIVSFAAKKPWKDPRDKFWKVRYLAISHLEELIHEPDCNSDEVQEAIIRRMSSKREKDIIRKKAYSVCKTLRNADFSRFIYLTRKVLEASEIVVNDNAPKVVEEERSKLEGRITRLEDVLASNFRLESNSSETAVDSEKLKQNLEALQNKRDALLSKEEELEEEEGRLEILQEFLREDA